MIVAAASVGLLAGAVQCDELRRCNAAGTCANSTSWDSSWATCSFSNYVDVVGDRLYGNNATDDASRFASLTRGVCAPGERLHRNSVTSAIECAPWRTWPDAFNLEIGDPDAAALHDQACGAWIDAGPVVQTTVQYNAFYDLERGVAAVEHADEDALGVALGQRAVLPQHLGERGAVAVRHHRDETRVVELERRVRLDDPRVVDADGDVDLALDVAHEVVLARLQEI